jgi:hypothetical protein
MPQRSFIEPPKAKFSEENVVTILILFFYSFKKHKGGPATKIKIPTPAA